MKRRVLILMQGNISLVPRARKAIETIILTGWDVDIVMINRHPKWRNLDYPILRALKAHFTYLSIRKDDGFFDWIISSIIAKATILLARFSHNIKLNAYASSKVNLIYDLFKNRYLIGRKYDFVWGFNSILFPSFHIAKKLNVPFAFDMEDYHPLENIYHANKEEEIKRRKRLLVDLLPKAAFVTYASPMIKAKSDELLSVNGVSTKCSEVINNTFNASDFKFAPCSDAKVQFVWFSQTISYERGLEQILPALNRFAAEIHLTIIGNLDPKFYDDILKPYDKIITIKPAMAQSELHIELGRYDIGLAIEQTDLLKDNGNKELCLSNKIFSYLLAGLYIFATNTPAQSVFIESHLGSGTVSGQSTDEMLPVIKKIIDSIDSIRQEKSVRFENARKYGWEAEQNKLTELIRSL